MSLLTTDAVQMRAVAAAAVDTARRLGAEHAVVSARATAAVQVTARQGAIDTALRDARQSLTLRLYRGARVGVATTAALDPDSVRRAAEEALALAALMPEDPDGLPASLADMATEVPLPLLNAPSRRDPGALRALALKGDAAIRAATVPAGVTVETVAMGVSTSESVAALATSAGFCRTQEFSNQSAWAVALARDANGAGNEFADSHDRRFENLVPVETLAARAAARAARQMGARAVASHRGPVLLEPRIAAALLGDLITALTGSAQDQKRTFLPGALGMVVAAEHLELHEDPHEPFGLASGAFDSEGVAGQRRAILHDGLALGYFLGTRSARRLGMVSTGNADGPWNLRLGSRLPGVDFDGLCQQMGQGLVITRMMGGATDPVTGNWTQAVSGLWVESGVPVHAVTDVTVGGNLRDMWKAVLAVGTDVERNGAIRTGSLLIDGLQIGGAA
ncbi:TldD/PmbA family protein [Sphingomonas sp. TDK1]|uniref:TldD/PmbA family protein n=1 Tax=Sphingomonas sp. TDK1 TaxID=453247 RepID=UPI0007D8F6FD|nr:metallopeptidase TldD-related protein [Sphingomonas sp. TDK1]OAN63905.1 hypothetical protein A7X12_19075 [Sphingomonas sp. TDK1]